MGAEVHQHRDSRDNAPLESNASTTGQPVLKKENHFLRSVCAFAALFLVIFHCNIPGYAGEMIQGVGRFAVPTFFMLSGYYCFSRDGHAESRLRQKTVHILKLAVLAKLLYTLLDLTYLLGGVITWDQFVHNTLLWSLYNMHLWFLYALFLVYVFWWLIGRLNIRYERLYFLIPVILLIDLVFAEFLPIMGIDTVDIGESTYPLIAIPFFMIGNALHRYEDRIDSTGWITIPVLLALIIGGAVLSLFEATAIPAANLYVGSLILAVSLFVFSYKVPEDRLRCRWLEYIGRNLAVWIYILHPALISLSVLALGQWITEDWAFPLEVTLVMILSIVVAYLVHVANKCISRKASQRRAGAA